MRRISLVGLCALVLALSVQQSADAWLNFKFGVGLNWNWQSGGNNFFWGLFRNGQPPGYGNHCDPSCLSCGSSWNPFNCAPYCPQQPCCQPYMMQPGACMPQPYPSCPQTSYQPLFPGFGNGLSNPQDFQYFGFQGSQNHGLSEIANTVSAYNPYTWGGQSSYSYPYSSWNYYGNPSNWYGSSPYSYGNGSGYYGNTTSYYGNGASYYGNSSNYSNNAANYYGGGNYYGYPANYYGSTANYYGQGTPCNDSSSSYHGNGYVGSTPAYYSYSSASYSNPYGASYSNYYPGYQASPYNYCHTTCCNYDGGR